MQKPKSLKYLESLIPYAPGKPIEETKKEFQLQEVIKCASNENSLGPAPEVMLWLQKAVQNPEMILRYPDSQASELRNKIAIRNHLNPSQIVIGNGSNELLALILKCYASSQNTLVQPEYSFIAAAISSKAQGMQIRSTPVSLEKCEIDFNALLDCAQKTPQAIVYIAHKNNPVPFETPESQLLDFCRKLQKSHPETLVILDKAYGEYQENPKPDAEWIQEFPQVVVLRTFSKIYALAGLRLGYVLCSEEIAKEINKVRDPFNVNSLALGAGIQALENTKLEFMRAENKKQASEMKSFFEKLGYAVYGSEVNFLLLKSPQMTGLEIFHQCLKKGLILRPLENYGLKQYIRYSIGNSDENDFAKKVLESIAKS